MEKSGFMFRGFLLGFVLVSFQLCIGSQRVQWTNADCEQLEDIIFHYKGMLDQGVPVPVQTRKEGAVSYVVVHRSNVRLGDGRLILLANTGYIDVTNSCATAEEYEVADGYLTRSIQTALTDQTFLTDEFALDYRANG